MKKYIGLITGLLPLIASAQLVMTNNYYVVMTGGSSANPTSLVLTNPAPSGITNTGTGWIISENEFNQVDWNIGTNTGTYEVPFGYSNAQYLPVTLDISTAGVGSGVVKFSTYHSVALNTPNPSDVTNLNAFILPGSPSNADDAYNIADRFYDIDANTGYTTKPAAGNITFSYISGTGNSEVAAPNVLDQAHLMAERFNSTTDTWSDWFGYGCTDAIVGNVGTVQTGPVPAGDMYRSWALWDNLTPLPLTMASTNILCGGNNTGSATVTVYGGVSAYTYAWSPSGGTLASASNLSAGSYTVTVTDSHGCLSTISVTITAPPTLVATATVTANATGCLSDGSASVTASGGTNPYTYLWTSGSTTTSATGLSAGGYTVTVHDHNGCMATASVTITAPNQLAANAAVTANASACASIGSAASSPSGGTSPYTYSWSNSAMTSSISALSAGTYTLLVTDIHGCMATASLTITAPAQVAANATVTANASACASIGSAVSSPSGGSSPYTYSWSNSAATSGISALSAGTYTLTVTDNQGCSATGSVTITAPAAVSASAAVNANTTECSSIGSATVTPGGGNSPYTYSWTGGNTNANATGLSAGNYTVTVTDNQGCTGTASVNITAPAALTAGASVTANTSECSSVGSAMVAPGGGTSPYTYSWTGGKTTASLTGLSAGTYTVSVTDNNGCMSTASITITQPAPLTLTQGSVMNTDVGGLCNGEAWVTVAGGNAAYTYSWSPGSQTTDTIKSQCNGTYCCTVTDANGCKDSICVIVSAVQDISNASSIKIYPDPNNGNFMVSGVFIGQVVELYNYLGQKITSVVADKTVMQFDISTKANGVYLVRIQNRDGSVVTQTKIIKTE